jgi:hypothetical protein
MAEIIGVWNRKTKSLVFFKGCRDDEQADRLREELEIKYETPNSEFTDLGDLIEAQDDVFDIIQYSVPRVLTDEQMQNLLIFNLNPTLIQS